MCYFSWTSESKLETIWLRELHDHVNGRKYLLLKQAFTVGYTNIVYEEHGQKFYLS